MVAITLEESRSVLQLAIGLIKRKSFTLKQLAEIAERSCCIRHHRNKIWGSKLADSLALRWQHEVLNYMPSASSKSAQIVKVENFSLPTSDVGGCPRQPVYTDQAQNHGQPRNLSKPVAFSKHVVMEGETMDAALLSVIEPSASKFGSVYIFTYKHDAFRGMIKIGYTSRSIDQRLNEWDDCGHGAPRLLDSSNNVRHPERAELLTHFQLMKHWYAMRWCNYHGQAHIEWFKADASTASLIIQSWSLWMQRSNPYDRRGVLKVFWQGIVKFLATYEICITAELMLQIQEVEEGSIDVTDFFDDDMLRKEHAKKGHVDSLSGAEAIMERNCGHPPKIKSENTCTNS